MGVSKNRATPQNHPNFRGIFHENNQLLGYPEWKPPRVEWSTGSPTAEVHRQVEFRCRPLGERRMRCDFLSKGAPVDGKSSTGHIGHAGAGWSCMLFVLQRIMRFEIYIYIIMIMIIISWFNIYVYIGIYWGIEVFQPQLMQGVSLHCYGHVMPSLAILHFNAFVSTCLFKILFFRCFFSMFWSLGRRIPSKKNSNVDFSPRSPLHHRRDHRRGSALTSGGPASRRKKPWPAPRKIGQKNFTIQAGDDWCLVLKNRWK